MSYRRPGWPLPPRGMLRLFHRGGPPRPTPETGVVRLRLKRFGRRNRSFYRVSAVDSRSPRDGRVLEELGYYDPANRDKAQQVKLEGERIKYWLGVGAVPSETVRNLLKKSGIL